MIRQRQGIALVYAAIIMTLMTFVCLIAIDVGRVHLVKTEMQAVADAAALAGVTRISHGIDSVRQNARKAAALNMANGVAVDLKDSDIRIGFWTGTAFQAGGTQLPNAVEITIQYTAERGNPVTAFFTNRSADLVVRSTAMHKAPLDKKIEVAGWANPWLAGMKKGTVANPNNPHDNPDVAGKKNPTYGTDPSPVEVTGLGLQAGMALTFAGISGQTNNDVNFDPNENFDPDGNFNWIVNNKYGNGGPAEHGKSDLVAPINAIVGVFLGPAEPKSTDSKPSRLEYRYAKDRNFTSVSPKVRQVFFIGDGMYDSDNDGKDDAPQTFIVPAGATRFYIAQMDEYEWNNNRGKREYRITQKGSFVLVK